MIRRAEYRDEAAIAAMLREMHDASKYKGRVNICEKTMANNITHMIASQGHRGPQGTFVGIAEEDGRVVGFMAGVLDRVYHIGDRLVAADAYLHVRPGHGSKHSLQLIEAYLEWASSNRKVLEIKLSWTDAIPGADRIGRLYERKGFTRVGEIYERRLDARTAILTPLQTA